MSKEEMVIVLGNALIMIDTVSAEGEKNWNALLACKQQIRKVYQAMKEVKVDGEHEDA